MEAEEGGGKLEPNSMEEPRDEGVEKKAEDEGQEEKNYSFVVDESL